jgi:hypothetical protein
MTLKIRPLEGRSRRGRYGFYVVQLTHFENTVQHAFYISRPGRCSLGSDGFFVLFDDLKCHLMDTNQFKTDARCSKKRFAKNRGFQCTNAF